jgi:DNA-binding response OmpR family regulator
VSNQPNHVLLIEDNQGDADLVRMRLIESNSDLQVSHADRLSTGLAALDVEPPAVVLLDLNLPDSRGAETFRNVLNKAPGVPVVVLSTLEDEALAAQAVHHGVHDYLVKGTFDGKQLARTLHYAIERHAAAALKAARDRAVAKGQYYTKKPVKGGTTFTCSFCEHSVTTLGFNNSNGNRRTQAVAAMNEHVSLFHRDLWKRRHSIVTCGRDASMTAEETGQKRAKITG